MLTVAGELHLIKRQASFRAPRTQLSCPRKSAIIVFRVVWDIERLASRELLETLLSVPGHILDCQQRSIRWHQKVKVTRPDDHIVGVFDNRF